MLVQRPKAEAREAGDRSVVFQSVSQCFTVFKAAMEAQRGARRRIDIRGSIAWVVGLNARAQGGKDAKKPAEFFFVGLWRDPLSVRR